MKSVPGVIPRRSNYQVLAGSWLGLLAWLAAAWVSPAIAHYPESDKRVTAPGQGYVQPIERAKLKRAKLLASDLSITTERFSAKNNRVNLAIIGDGYQRAELESLYQPTVRDTLDYFLTHPKSAPYPRYRNFLNIFRIDIPSNDSGVDDLEAGIVGIRRSAAKMAAPIGPLVSAVQTGPWFTRRLISLKPQLTLLQTGDWSC